jgi:hypothetical protein
MIGGSVRHRDQSENEAMQWIDLRTPPRVAFADHMDAS